MEDIVAHVKILPLAMLFIMTGLYVNFLQVACYLTVRPLSKTAFRRINGAIAEILWLALLFLLQWWGRFEVKLYADEKTCQLMGKEHGVVMPNHISDVDTLLMWVLAQRFDCLRSVLTIVKKSTKYLPIFGWAIYFCEFIFLDRTWAKDEIKLKTSFESLKDFPRPFWLTIFVEGTRMSSDKLLEAQKFAASQGLPIPRNVLVPRTKGFVMAVKHLRSFVPAVYDITIAVPRGHPVPTLLDFLKQKSTLIKVHIKRYSMKELPESDEGLAQWCKDRFIAKDALLDKFLATDTFEDQEIKDPGRSMRPLMLFFIACFQASLLFWTACQKLSLLSTWRGNAILTAILGATAMFEYAVIKFTYPLQQKSQKLLCAQSKIK